MKDFSLLPFLEKHFSPEEPFIVACSTGADSMFLAYKILETRFRKNMIVAHFNHHTRKECADEEKFILTLGKKENFQVEIGECDFEKLKKLYPGKSFEELAREKRYQFFDALCHIHGAKKVILAHHLDDRIETMLFNMLRGTKLSGLINMKEVSGSLYRPLLHLEKKEIYEYLKEKSLPFFEDTTNQENIYTRNFIRNEITPLFEKVNPGYKGNVQNLLSYFEEIENEIQNSITHFLKNFTVYKDSTLSFHLSDFFILSPFIQKEIIKELYKIHNNSSTIGLNKGNISEILKLFHGKNTPTFKDIHGLVFHKKGDLISLLLNNFVYFKAKT